MMYLCIKKCNTLVDILDNVSSKISSCFSNITECKNIFIWYFFYKEQLSQIIFKCTMVTEMSLNDLNNEELFSDLKDIIFLFRG